MSKTVGIALLAAGEGKRLKLNDSKPLAPLCGQRLVDFPLTESLAFAQKAKLHPLPIVVTGHCREEVEGYLNKKYSDQVQFAFQREQRGTADALKAYFKSNEKTQKTDLTLVLCADTPLIRRSDLWSLFESLEGGKDEAVAAVFHADNPHGYGRVIMGESGFHIVEEKEVNDETRQISRVNSGLYLFKTSFLLNHLDHIKGNAHGEFYLTHIFQDHLKVKAILFPNNSTFLGVNTPTQLSEAEYHIRQEINKGHQENGVHIIDHRHTYIDWDVSIGTGSVIHPNTFIYSGTKVGAHVTIEPHCIIKKAEIRDHVYVKGHCYVEGAIIREQTLLGPFARIRPGTDIGKNSKIGNFVEIKEAKLEQGVKVSHLSYLGDAEIGEETNIGCGFITCNYDGVNKHKTIIGKRAFIGSDTQTIAPVSIGDEAYIASGSTINKDVPHGSFAVARARQVNKEGMAKRFKK